MASKPKKRYTKPKSSTTEGIECVDQDGASVPIRAIYFRHVPPKMTPNSLKLALQEMYDGPVQTVILKSHRMRLAGSSHQSSQYAIVHFQHAATATAVLRQRRHWPDGQLISASPANNQSAKDADGSPTTYTDQTRLRRLNDDCLLLLYDYLSLWDIVRLTESSSQLLDFATENAVFEKHARDGVLPASDQHIAFALFDKTMKHLGPHLTTLLLEGSVCGRLDLAQCITSVLDNAPHLVRLQLDAMFQPEHSKRKSLQKFGQHSNKLKELCLNICVLPDCRWLWAFLDQATSLEVLALHDLTDDQYDMTELRYPKKMFVCPKLHTLSLRCSEHSTKLLLDAMRAHRKTLRHLFFDIDECYEVSKYYSAVCKMLPDLEGIMVAPQMANANCRGQLAKMRRLRKIIVRSGDAHSLGWLKSLAAGPNAVEHLVLLETSLTPDVCTIVGGLGAQLHTLELHRNRCEDSDALQQLGATLQHLRTLEIHSGSGVMKHLPPAVVQASAEFESIVFGEPWMDREFLPATLAALRTAVEAAAAAAAAADKAAGGAVKRVSLNVTDEVDAECRALLLANADIVSWNGRVCTDRRAPMEEYHYAQRFLPGFESDDYDSDINDYDMFDDDYDDYDDYDDDDFVVYDEFNNENGFMAGNAFLNEIMRM